MTSSHEHKFEYTNLGNPRSLVPLCSCGELGPGWSRVSKDGNDHAHTCTGSSRDCPHCGACPMCGGKELAKSQEAKAINGR